MSNTVTTSGPVASISTIDSDWIGEQRALQSIQFNPGASGDTLVVKHKDENGPVIFKSVADGASDEVIKYFHDIGLKPFIDQSQCVLSGGHLVIVVYGD